MLRVVFVMGVHPFPFLRKALPTLLSRSVPAAPETDFSTMSSEQFRALKNQFSRAAQQKRGAKGLHLLLNSRCRAAISRTGYFCIARKQVRSFSC